MFIPLIVCKDSPTGANAGEIMSHPREPVDV
jgi:hypothetical protein